MKSLLDILRLDCVKVPLSASGKKEAIGELVDLLAAAGVIKRPDIIFDCIWEREQVKSTGIGLGLAIPHGKPASLDRIVMAIGKASEPIDFGAVDGKPVHMIVLIATPPEKTSEHIQLLARISRIMTDEALRQAAYQAQTAEQLYSLIKAREETISA